MEQKKITFDSFVRGFLAVIIIAAIVIGLLSFSLYGMVKNERIEAFRRYESIQASLELESGVNYAFHRMQHNGKPWLTDSLTHASANGEIRFSLSQKQDGAFANLTVYNHDSSRSFSARTGFNIPSSPALVMLTPQANISLVGNAKIEGGTAVRAGMAVSRSSTRNLTRTGASALSLR